MEDKLAFCSGHAAASEKAALIGEEICSADVVKTRFSQVLSVRQKEKKHD